MCKSFLEKAVKLVGGQVAMAKATGVKQAHVWGWLNKTKDGTPAERVIAICNAVNWQVTPHQLRPDIYPHPDDGLPQHLRSAA